MSRVLAIVATLMLAAEGLLAQTVFAQTAAATPTSTRDQNAEDDAPITLRGSLTQAYDDNAAADTPIGITATRLGLFSGMYSAANAELTFRRKGRSSMFSGDAGTAVRYDPALLDLTTATYQASARLQKDLGATGHLTLSQSARYAPLLTLDALGADTAGGGPGASAFDAALSTVGQLQARSGADFDFNLTRNTTFTATSQYSSQQLANAADSIRRYEAGARVTHSLTRHLDMSSGYTHQTNVGATDSHVHDALLSIAYDAPLSETRHVRFEASIGASMLDQLGRRLVRSTTSARVSRDIGQTWSIGGAFSRQYVYFDWLAEPLFANRFSADLRGHLTRRLLARFEGSYAGNQEMASSANAFTVSLAGGSLIYTLTPQLGLYVGYTRFHYDFVNGDALAGAIAPLVGRNSVRGGLTLQLPLARGNRERTAQ
jgi:hypothetical protein